MNANDGVLRRVDSSLRDLVVVDFVPIPGSEAGELAANFDMIVGTTPEDPEERRGPRGRSEPGSPPRRPLQQG